MLLQTNCSLIDLELTCKKKLKKNFKTGPVTEIFTISSAKLFAISSAMKAKIHQKCSKGGRGYFGKAEENLDILEKDENSKRKKIDNKEGFDMGNDRNTIDYAFFGAPNLFPPEDAIPGFREWADRYHNVSDVIGSSKSWKKCHVNL